MKGIEWTEETWNPLRGCSRVSAGCQNCYAERMACRLSSGPYKGLVRSTKNGPRWTGKVQFVESQLAAPYKWREPRMVFVNSMSDLFHEQVSDSQIMRIYRVIAENPRHTFQVLTKRPERAAEWFAKTGAPALPNLWIGTSVENQDVALQITKESALILDGHGHQFWVPLEELHPSSERPSVNFRSNVVVRKRRAAEQLRLTA